MDFVAPLDAANPGDPYVDENPNAGIDGSIVPAAFFNQGQRELVNLILGAGLVPDPDDLTQVLEAILALIAAGSGGGGTGEVPAARLISTTEGLTGGGDLSANRTHKLDFGGLAAAGAIAGSDLVAIYSLLGTAHKKVTIDDLAAALAGTVTVADTYTETDLAISGQVVTVNPLPTANERLIVSFSVANTRYAPASLQANLGGSWVTLASLAADICLDPEIAPTINGQGNIGLIYAAGSSKLWVTGVPGRINKPVSLKPIGLNDTGYVFADGPAAPVLGHGMNLAKLKSTGAAWDGQLRLISSGAAISGVKKYSPLVIA